MSCIRQLSECFEFAASAEPLEGTFICRQHQELLLVDNLQECLSADFLLAMLDQLNPLDPATNRRQCVINCIQFLDPDPLDTLKKIADIHGGPKGYKFLDRSELGLSTR